MKNRNHFPSRIFLVVTLGLLLLVSGITPAAADVAPPYQPPGSNLVPDEEEQTQVQMVAETVTIDVQTSAYPYTTPDTYEGWSLSEGWATVNAVFHMQNQGSETEEMQVRFPLTNPYGWGDGFFNNPQIQHFNVKVDQQALDYTQVDSPATNDAGEPEMAWAAFDVTFPPGEEVIIEVDYAQWVTDYDPLMTFDYLLATGAGWKGAIGSADLIFRLPYQASQENVVVSETSYLTEVNAEFSGNEIRWHLEELEPEKSDDVHITTVTVARWQEVLDAREVAAENPDSGEAWGRLARAIKMTLIMNKGWLREDMGAAALYEESAAAYQKAVEMSPREPRWHAGYAELLWGKIAWEVEENYPILVQAMQELNTALELDPDNEQALYILEEMSWSAPEEAIQEIGEGEYDLLILTATVLPKTRTPWETLAPIASETVPPTVTPMPSSTPPVEEEAVVEESAVEEALTEKPQPAPTQPAQESGKAPLCGSVLLVLVALGVAKWRLMR